MPCGPARRFRPWRGKKVISACFPALKRERHDESRERIIRAGVYRPRRKCGAIDPAQMLLWKYGEAAARGRRFCLLLKMRIGCPPLLSREGKRGVGMARRGRIGTVPIDICCAAVSGQLTASRRVRLYCAGIPARKPGRRMLPAERPQWQKGQTITPFRLYGDRLWLLRAGSLRQWKFFPGG